MAGPWDTEIEESGNGPYLRMLGITIEEADAGHAVLRMPWSAGLDTFRINHVMHGGAIASLIDAAASMALRTLHRPEDPPWRITSTSDLNISYLNAATKDIVAEASVLRSGRTIAFFQIDVRDSDGTMVAVGRATMYIRPGD
jgi:uncharacterized protein (TIGR00369 family)